MSRFIDAHHHVWDPANADDPWMTDALAVIGRKFDTADLRDVIGRFCQSNSGCGEAGG